MEEVTAEKPGLLEEGNRYWPFLKYGILIIGIGMLLLVRFIPPNSFTPLLVFLGLIITLGWSSFLAVDEKAKE